MLQVQLVTNFSTLVFVLLCALVLASIVRAFPSMRVRSRQGWVHRNGQSVKAGVNVDRAGSWYAWGSVWCDGAVPRTDDPRTLWVQGTLFYWDGERAVVCEQTDWFHPSDRALYALRDGSPRPRGQGFYLVRASAYRRVCDGHGNYAFHGGSLDSPWTWVA